VLEAIHRAGGRVYSIKPSVNNTYIDLGASWVYQLKHNPIKRIANQLQLKTFKFDESSLNHCVYVAKNHLNTTPVLKNASQTQLPTQKTQNFNQKENVEYVKNYNTNVNNYNSTNVNCVNNRNDSVYDFQNGNNIQNENPNNNNNNTIIQNSNSENYGKWLNENEISELFIQINELAAVFSDYVEDESEYSMYDKSMDQRMQELVNCVSNSVSTLPKHYIYQIFSHEIENDYGGKSSSLSSNLISERIKEDHLYVKRLVQSFYPIIQELTKGLPIHYQKVVKSINYTNKETILIQTSDGFCFKTKKFIVTVPIQLIKNNFIQLKAILFKLPFFIHSL
jgi:hypothetical protein